MPSFIGAPRHRGLAHRDSLSTAHRPSPNSLSRRRPDQPESQSAVSAGRGQELSGTGDASGGRRGPTPPSAFTAGSDVVFRIRQPEKKIVETAGGLPEPVPAPFPYVPIHIVQAYVIWLFCAQRLRSAPAVGREPSNPRKPCFIAVCAPPAERAAPRGVFPFGARRQPISGHAEVATHNPLVRIIKV